MGPIGHRLLADDPMGLLDFSPVNNMVWAFFSPLFLLRFSLLLGLLQSERNSQNFWLNFGEKFVQPFLLKMTVWILAGAIVTKDDYEPHKHTPYHSQLHLVFWSPGERSSGFCSLNDDKILGRYTAERIDESLRPEGISHSFLIYREVYIVNPSLSFPVNEDRISDTLSS